MGIFRLTKIGKKALTFVEMLISILILGIALGVMLSSFVMGRYSAAAARHRIEAMSHAQAAIELLKDDISATFVIPTGDITALNGVYSQTITDYVPSVKKVDVTITWDELSRGSLTSLSEQIVTLIRE